MISFRGLTSLGEIVYGDFAHIVKENTYCIVQCPAKNFKLFVEVDPNSLAISVGTCQDSEMHKIYACFEYEHGKMSNGGDTVSIVSAYTGELLKQEKVLFTNGKLNIHSSLNENFHIVIKKEG